MWIAVCLTRDLSLYTYINHAYTSPHLLGVYRLWQTNISVTKFMIYSRDGRDIISSGNIPSVMLGSAVVAGMLTPRAEFGCVNTPQAQHSIIQQSRHPSPINHIPMGVLDATVILKALKDILVFFRDVEFDRIAELRKTQLMFSAWSHSAFHSQSFWKLFWVF